MPREPIVAGQFYDGGFEELDKQISSCFEGRLGPGALPVKRTEKGIFGIVAPHAGYVFSGPCQAWAYKEIAESKFPDLYILVGLSHSGFPTCLSLEDWETPLGVVKVDKEFGKLLVEKGVKHDEDAHSYEHSIEVQLPFLQFANRDKLNQIKILPIIASEDIGCSELAGKIVKTIRETGKSAVFIASSDFTHFGVSYGYMPFRTDIKNNMYKLDKGAIRFIEEMASSQFLGYIDKTGATICGRIPIAVVIEACKMLGAKEGHLLHYYTSGDVHGDYVNAVGYGAIVFR